MLAFQIHGFLVGFLGQGGPMLSIAPYLKDYIQRATEPIKPSRVFPDPT